MQAPGVARVWYAYPGQDRSRPIIEIGTSTVAAVEARVLDDGTTQARQTTVNSHDRVLERIDPLGRRTTYTYAPNGQDPLEVRQTTGTTNDLLAAYANYTTSHQPQAVTDAAGQTTAITYSATGQVATVTNALQETTTYAYDTAGYLTSVIGPVTGATTTYTYDAYGRPRTVTHDGVTITTDYDLFDRPTSVWYPDGTREISTYDRLDLATRADRLGRATRSITDGLRRRVATRDPAGRTTV